MTTTIDPPPVLALQVTRVTRREYQLTDEHGRPCATLRVGWPIRRGEISTEYGTWLVRRHLRGQVATGEGDQPLVRLIVIRLPALSGRRFAIELTGDWEHRDVVVLTGCFALLARRRRDIAIMVAISSSHGS